jgi:hypothetical protein
MFQTEVVEKIETHTVYSITFFFRKSCRLWNNVELYCKAGQATDDNMAHAHCVLDNYGYRYSQYVDCVWNVMAHAQKPDFVFRRNGRVHLNRRGRQFSRLLAAEVCPSAVILLDTPCSEVVWRVLATHFIRQFPLHFPSRASPCAITFQLVSNTWYFSTVTMVARKRLNITLYIYCLSCVIVSLHCDYISARH